MGFKSVSGGADDMAAKSAEISIPASPVSMPGSSVVVTHEPNLPAFTFKGSPPQIYVAKKEYEILSEDEFPDDLRVHSGFVYALDSAKSKYVSADKKISNLLFKYLVMNQTMRSIPYKELDFAFSRKEE